MQTTTAFLLEVCSALTMDLSFYHAADAEPMIVLKKAMTRLRTRGFHDMQKYLDGVRADLVSRDDVDEVVFRDTLQVCSLFSKFPIPRQGTEYLDWKALQASIGNLSIDFESFALNAERWLMVFNDVHADDWLARPNVGPGAVFEHLPHVARVKNRLTDRKWESLSHSKFVNRPVTVPKTWKSDRLIFVEESDRMLLQQSVRAQIEDVIDTTWIGKYYVVRSQERNRRLVRADGFSTIDLSAASDWISAAQVFRLFRRTPVLRSLLFKLRPRRTNDSTLIRSYGTMGNALTFPVMSILFCCVLRLAEEEAKARGVLVERGSVFGDDIVCDRRIYGTVLGLLTRLGYKPNRTKSFVGTSYRESCGVDMFYDTDVTPLKIKKVPCHDQATETAFDSYSNRSHLAGNWHLANLLARYGTNTIVHHRQDYGLFSFLKSHIVLLPKGKWKWSRRLQTYVSRRKREPNMESPLDSEDTLAFWLLHGNRLTTY